MTDLLQNLRTELNALTRRTMVRAGTVPFQRTKDPRGSGIITVLAPTEEQRQAAKSDGDKLMRWSRVVEVTLQRRGISAAVDRLTRLTREMAPLLLLERQDVAEVSEGVWRRGFERELVRTSAALQSLLTDTAAAFEILQRRPTMDYTPFPMHLVQLARGQWTVQAERSAELITLSDVRNLDARTDIETIVATGHALYCSVFVGAVREEYVAARQQASDEGRGLRIELYLERAGELSSAPWELLYDGCQFVSMCQGSAVARMVDVQQLRSALPLARPLRILLTISAPRSFSWLDAERERQRIEAAVAPLTMLGLMELQVASDGSINMLRRMFASASAAGRPFDGWHFIGHGEFDERAGRGTLVMTDEKREAHHVGGWELVTLFRDQPRLRFAILNACEGARTSPKSPMSGVATALIEAGIERVVAMQFPISDRAAIVFAEEVYGALADGMTFDEAVVEGRRGIFYRPNAAEWITPVMFMPALGGGSKAVRQEGGTQK
jgi:hypothetical protein